MASCLCFCSSPSALVSRRPNSYLNRRFPRIRSKLLAYSDQDGNLSGHSTKLVTFLGKGGSGKTTTAVFAAQHFAMAGHITCLVLHTQDPTAEYLLNCKIGTSPTLCSNNLSAVRLETTKMLLEPLKRLKEADARLNMTQGVLEGIVGEELGVLPGMDSIFSAFALERLVRFFGGVAQDNHHRDKFDIIIYDGISSDEFLRMIGAPSKARLYLKYLRSIAQNTDLGRLAGPSLMRLIDESMSFNRSRPLLNGKMSSEIWDTLEQMLERGSSALVEQHKFGCFLVMDPRNRTSVDSALRYWGCTIQAGAQVSGAFAIASVHMDTQLLERVEKNFSPLPFASVPEISIGSDLDWNAVILNPVAEEARNIFSSPAGHRGSRMPSVDFDMVQRTVTLLMPGFDKSEIKLYQYRGGSELLVEAGDQRRVIHLPSKIQGQVAGAKFIDRTLVIKMR